jgi:hypothetical protein
MPWPQGIGRQDITSPGYCWVLRVKARSARGAMTAVMAMHQITVVTTG